VDDKDFWEEEYTDLDRFQKRKNSSNAMARLETIPQDFGLTGKAITNDAIVKALEENPHGWMMTNISRNATHFDGSYRIVTMPSIESEVTIKVWDEDLLFKLVEVMRHMSS
jgi:hypothetical protein